MGEADKGKVSLEQVRAIVREELQAASERLREQNVLTYQHHRRTQQRMHVENQLRAAALEKSIGTVHATISDPKDGMAVRLKGVETSVEITRKEIDNSRNWSRTAVVAAAVAVFNALWNWKKTGGG